MKKLIKKYRSDALSQAELDQSREQAAMMDDSSLDKVIFDDWCSTASDYDSVDVPSGSQRRIKRRIDSGLGLVRSPWVVVWKAVRIAAVVLLPLFVVATAVLYFHEEELQPSVVTVATQFGERTTVTLPDSSVVRLNGSTSLACDYSGFIDAGRSVEFVGEAYFDITKDPEHPFTVSTANMQVTVLGTKFNLEARKGADKAVLYLEEGLVRMTSNITGETVEVHPNERAVMSYADGHISVMEMHPDDNTMAWINGRLVFRDEPMTNVFEVMGNSRFAFHRNHSG